MDSSWRSSPHRRKNEEQELSRITKKQAEQKNEKGKA